MTKEKELIILTRLQLNPEEEITRKEYLKRKKKQKQSLKKKSKYADFKARVKDNAKEWWENTKEYWSKKVGKVKEFTTDVKDSAKEWWNPQRKR